MIGQVRFFLCRGRPDELDKPLYYVATSENWKRVIMSFGLGANIGMSMESERNRLYAKAETVEVKKRK